MVANAIGRSAAPRPDMDEDVLESGLRDNITRQLAPLMARLKNRWVILVLFIAAYIPFGFIFLGAYQDYNVLQGKISAQQAVLALPEPRTDDIETGLRSWTAALDAASQAQVLELADSTLVERILAAANSTGIAVESLSTSRNVVTPVGSEVYDTTPILLRVLGDLAAIESFIALLEGDAVEALEVKNSIVAPAEEGFGAALTVLVFNRPVDPSELSVAEAEALSRRVTDAELDAAAGGRR